LPLSCKQNFEIDFEVTADRVVVPVKVSTHSFKSGGRGVLIHKPGTDEVRMKQ